MPNIVSASALVLGLVAGLNGGGGVAPQLRMAGAEARYPVSTFVSSGTKLSFFTKRTCHIGSSDYSGFAVRLTSAMLAGTGDAAASAYTITKIALERVSPAQYQPLLFGGQAGITINAGTAEVLTDTILPAAFGLAKFTLGDIYVIRIDYTIAAAGLSLPAMESTYTAQTTDYDISFDPATGSIGPAYGIGAPVVTATTFSFMTTARFCCHLVGYPINPNAKWVANVGDSIVAGKNNLETTGFAGVFNRALVGPDGNTITALLAGCNFGLSGSTSSLWTTAPIAIAFFKYFNVLVEEFGTNGSQSASQLNICRSLWATMKALGGKVIRTKIMAETTSTDSWATAGNQTKLTNYLPAGTVDQWDASMLTYLGTEYDAYCDFSAITKDTGSGDVRLWVSTGAANYATTDGTHPTGATICVPMAVKLRSVIDAL